MRKWQNLAPPDDPNSWFDVFNVWPTASGSYETAAIYAGDNLSGGPYAGTQSYAFSAKTLTGTREYVVTAAKIFEYSATTLTDRTGGVAVGSNPMMAQFGAITLCVMGNATATVSSNGGNFAALAGAPKGEIVLVVDGAALILNTDTSPDGWAASDVFDYTNWTTGEAASGRLLDTPGPILAGCAFGGYAYAFKATSIYRGNYVGGQVKWEWHLVWSGVSVGSLFTTTQSKHYVGAGADCMMFVGQRDSASFSTSGSKTASSYVYLYDGVSAPRCVNPLTTIVEGAVLYDPSVNMFTVFPLQTSTDRMYFYSVPADAWGYYGTPLGAGASTNPPRPVMGAYETRAVASPLPAFYYDDGTNLHRNAPFVGTTADMVLTPYVQTAMYGRSDGKTLGTCVIPQFRRLLGGVDGLGAAHAMVCTVDLYRERHDASSQRTITATQNSQRVRFDFTGVDNFARVKITFPYRNVEIDDIGLVQQQAGQN